MSPGTVFLPRERATDQRSAPKPAFRFGLGTWITVLILGILLPMSILAGIATRQAVQSTREVAQSRLMDLSRALATAIDNHLKAQLAAMETLSLSPALDGGRERWDVPAIDEYARQIGSRLGAAVAVFAPDGEQIVNTLMPRGAVLPKTALGSMVKEAVLTRKPVVSELTRSSVTGRLGFGVGLPVERDGEVVAVLATLSNTSILHEILAQQNLPDGIFASLVDRSATIVARSDVRHSDFAGRRIVEDNARKLAMGSFGNFSGYSLEGTWREFSFTKLNVANGWSMVVAQTIEDMNAESERYSTRLALIGIFILAVSGTLALVVTRLIVKPIAALDRYAGTLGRVDTEDRPFLESAYITQVARLQDNVLAAERRLRANESRFRELLQLLDLAIFMARHLDGTIFYWSRGAEEFYGFSREEAVGRVSHDLLQTEFSVPLDIIEDDLRIDGQWAGGLTHLTKEGRRVNVIAQMSMTLLDSGETHVLEIIHDVSDLHRTQRELELALETGEIGTFHIDLQTGEVTFDERSRTLLGAKGESMKRDEFVALIPPDQQPEFNAALARCIGVRGDGLLDVEITIAREGHGAKVISIRGQAERSAGTPVAIAGVMMDVTRLRQNGSAAQIESVSNTG